MNINHFEDQVDLLLQKLNTLEKVKDNLIREDEETKAVVKEIFIESQVIEEAAFALEKRQESTSEKIKKFSKEQREEKNKAMKIVAVIVFLAGTIFFLIAKALTKA